MEQIIDHLMGKVQSNEIGDTRGARVMPFPKCAFLGTKADFYIGLMGSSPDAEIGNLDAISAGMVEKAIINLLGKGSGEIKWPVIFDLNKNVLYHSYEAHENGLSATQGWKAYCVIHNMVDFVPTLE